MAALGRVEGAHHLGVRDVVRPVDAQGLGGASEPGDRAVGGDGQRTEDPGAGVAHECGGRHAGEQGDLGVPALGGHGRAVLQTVAATARDDLLLGYVERDAAPGGLLLLAQQSDDPEQGEGLLGRSRVDLPLDARVVELGAAAYEGAAHLGGDRTALRVEVDPPEGGGPGLAREEAGGSLGEHRGVQGDPAVGEVEGRHPAVGLGVRCAAGADEGADVGDGVEHAEAVRAPFQVHRLVEVRGAGRVDGEERQVRGVQVAGDVRGFRRLHCLGEDGGREAGGQAEPGAQGVQGRPQRGSVRAGQVQVAAGHAIERRPGRCGRHPGLRGSGQAGARTLGGGSRVRGALCRV